MVMVTSAGIGKINVLVHERSTSLNHSTRFKNVVKTKLLQHPGF